MAPFMEIDNIDYLRKFSKFKNIQPSNSPPPRTQIAAANFQPHNENKKMKSLIRATHLTKAQYTNQKYIHNINPQAVSLPLVSP